MANLFDATNAPEGEPLEVVVGDFAQWKRSDLVSDYPTDEYTATFIARITAGGTSEISVTATDGGDHFLFTINSAASASFVAGSYFWQLEISQNSSGNRKVVSDGRLVISPDLDEAGADPRIHAEIMVAKIESILEGKADSDVGSYSIAGRSLTKLSFAELQDARERYQAEIVRHNTKELAKKGKQTSSTIKVRF